MVMIWKEFYSPVSVQSLESFCNLTANQQVLVPHSYGSTRVENWPFHDDTLVSFSGAGGGGGCQENSV